VLVWYWLWTYQPGPYIGQWVPYIYIYTSLVLVLGPRDQVSFLPFMRQVGTYNAYLLVFRYQHSYKGPYCLSSYQPGEVLTTSVDTRCRPLHYIPDQPWSLPSWYYWYKDGICLRSYQTFIGFLILVLIPVRLTSLVYTLDQYWL